MREDVVVQNGKQCSFSANLVKTSCLDAFLFAFSFLARNKPSFGKLTVNEDCKCTNFVLAMSSMSDHEADEIGESKAQTGGVLNLERGRRTSARSSWLSVMHSKLASSAFTHSVVRRSEVRTRRRRAPICATSAGDGSRLAQVPRRLFMQCLTLLPLGALARAEAAQPLEQTVAPVVMCRTIMNPVRRYIQEGAWDKGRTNVNYCTRILALRKNMKTVAEQLSGDDYYDALDIAAEIENTMAQLDASLYTPLFIPADDGVSLEQRKYQMEATIFYSEAMQYLDSFLNLVPSDVLDRARARADKARYEIKFEVE